MQIQKVAEIGIRSIQGDGKHSFQIYSTMTGHVMFTAPMWFDTVEELNDEIHRIKNKITYTVTRTGLEVKLNKQGGIEIYTDSEEKLVASMENMLKTVQDKTEEIMGMAHAPAEIVNNDQGTRLLGALVTDNHTGQFGYAVITEEGKMLLLPTRWFASAEEAQKAAKDDPSLKSSIVSEISKQGIGRVTFTDDYQTVEGAEAKAVIDKLKANKYLQGPNDQEHSKMKKIFRSLGGFDPSVN